MTIKSSSLLAVLAASVFGATSFAQQQQPSPIGQPQQPQPIKQQPQPAQGEDEANAARIVELKTQIRAITDAVVDRFDSDDNRVELREQLEPLVTELEQLSPKRERKEMLPLLVGSWRQLWSDMEGKPGEGALRAHIYQVVFPDNHFWNVALTEIGGQRETLFLRGDYRLSDRKQGHVVRVRYTEALAMPEWLRSGTVLSDVTMKAEVDAFPAKTDFPQGFNPLGKRGEAREVYVDENLRIVRVIDKAGSQDKAEQTKAEGILFILERVSVVGAVEGETPQ